MAFSVFCIIVLDGTKNRHSIVSYTQDWDADIISQLEATKNEMAVLTTYLTDVQGSIDANGNSLRNTRPIMVRSNFTRHFYLF